MKTIYKYTLNWNFRQTLQIPLIAVLDIQMQNDELCLWALVETEDGTNKSFDIWLAGTGTSDLWLIKRQGNLDTSYLKTIQNGDYVFHIFLTESEEE